jgi:hypothetical protein
VRGPLPGNSVVSITSVPLVPVLLITQQAPHCFAGGGSGFCGLLMLPLVIPDTSPGTSVLNLESWVACHLTCLSVYKDRTEWTVTDTSLAHDIWPRER